MMYMYKGSKMVGFSFFDPLSQWGISRTFSSLRTKLGEPIQSPVLRNHELNSSRITNSTNNKHDLNCKSTRLHLRYRLEEYELCVLYFYAINLNQKRSQTDALHRTWDRKVLDITVPSAAISSIVRFGHDREPTRSRLKWRSPPLLVWRRSNQSRQCSFHQFSFHAADSNDRVRHGRSPHIQPGWRKRRRLAMAAAARDVLMKTAPERAWMCRRRAHTSPLDIRHRSILPGNDSRSIWWTRTVINEETDRRSKRRRWINIDTARRGGSRLMMMATKTTMVIITKSRSRRVKVWTSRWSKRGHRRRQGRRVAEPAARRVWSEHRAAGSGFRGRRRSHHLL